MITDDDGVLLMTDMEQKIGIDSLDALQNRRRQIMGEWKTLRALHGPPNRWEVRRKQRLEAAKVQARIDLAKTGEKVTEAMVDTTGHCQKDYDQFIEDGITSTIRYIELESEMLELSERAENRIAMIYAWGKEASLTR